MTQTNETHPVHFEISRLDRFSDWFRAKRAIAVCLRLKQRLKEGKEAEQVVRYQPVNVNEIGQAEIEIIRCPQHEHFKEEIKILSSLQESEEFHDRKRANSATSASRNAVAYNDSIRSWIQMASCVWGTP